MIYILDAAACDYTMIFVRVTRGRVYEGLTNR